MKEFILPIVISILSFIPNSLAQGEMLKKGEYGIFSSYSYVLSSDATG